MGFFEGETFESVNWEFRPLWLSPFQSNGSLKDELIFTWLLLTLLLINGALKDVLSFKWFRLDSFLINNALKDELTLNWLLFTSLLNNGALKDEWLSMILLLFRYFLITNHIVLHRLLLFHLLYHYGFELKGYFFLFL